VSVVSVASEQAYGTCANCGSALVSDQRYCLECGAPASPVRLAFLDVLQNGQDVAARSAPGVYEGTVVSAAGMLPAQDPFAQPGGVNSWLRRNSGILSLLSVLALCLIAGLLIGHWATQGGAPSKQVIELKGLPASASLPASSAATGASTTTKSTGKSAAATKAEEEAEEKTEAKETAAEKAPPPEAKKVNLSKLSKSTGKKHQEEINANGAAPIETG
jgi:hypothetical protein